MKNIFWSGYVLEDRLSGIEKVKRIIAEYGDVVNFNMFSDLSISLEIEITENRLYDLYQALNHQIQMDPTMVSSSLSTKQRVLYLNLSFSKGSGNLKINVPAVPG
jgi:hypothetical protein